MPTSSINIISVMNVNININMNMINDTGSTAFMPSIKEPKNANARIVYTKDETALLSSLPSGSNILLHAMIHRILRTTEDIQLDAISGIIEELEPFNSVR